MFFVSDVYSSLEAMFEKICTARFKKVATHKLQNHFFCKNIDVDEWLDGMYS